MRKFIVSALMIMSIGRLHAQNAFNADTKTCDLAQNTTLKSLCPNGFGQPDWSGGMRSYINRQPNIANMIVDSANRYGVDPNLALAVAGTESGLSACAGSFSGVKGPMQLTQDTAKSYGFDRDNISGNINGGIMTLKAAINACGGSSNIRCLADRYNGSSERERQNWTNRTTANLADLRNSSMPIPAGCNGTLVCGPGDFPFGSPVAGTPPVPTNTDIFVTDGQI